MKSFLFLLLIVVSTTTSSIAQTNKAILIENKTWVDAQALLTDSTIVVIPLGAAAKEHGPHLLLKNDFLIAEYLKERIAKTEKVVIYPTLNYHFYPAFLEYPGSTSLRLETASDLLIDVCRIISAHGPKKFYILNTGVSTLVPLKIATEKLAKQGILMTFTDILTVAKEAESKVKQEKAGTHADEIETSMMLYMAPQTVDMKKAVKDIPEKDAPGPLTLIPTTTGHYSPSGIFGDATLATREKGEIIVEAMVAGVQKEIWHLRNSKVLSSSFSNTTSKVIGSYEIALDDFIQIFEEDGKLYAQRNKDRRLLLQRETENSFYAGQTGRLIFFSDEQGKYQTAYLNLLGRDLLCKRKN
jgi:creatinine amidohydrolase